MTSPSPPPTTMDTLFWFGVVPFAIAITVVVLSIKRYGDGHATRDCETCGTEFSIESGENAPHFKVERVMSSGRGIDRGYYCSRGCAVEALEGNNV